MSPTSYRTAPPRIIRVSIHPVGLKVKGGARISLLRVALNAGPAPAHRTFVNSPMPCAIVPQLTSEISGYNIDKFLVYTETTNAAPTRSSPGPARA